MTVVYDLKTGEIISAGLVKMSIEDMEFVKRTRPGVGFLDGVASPETHYVSGGRLVEKGERPSLSHVWTASGWSLSRSLAEENASSRRRALLAMSDWTQMPDVSLKTKDEWAVYRQALRDITKQPGYPTEIVWPVAP